MKKTWILLFTVFAVLALTGCSKETLDYNNPDVDLFVKQLKAGTYNTKNDKGIVEVPHFTENDIPELLNYAEDMSVIPSFPSVYNSNSGKIRLGECILWTVKYSSGLSGFNGVSYGRSECRKLRSNLFLVR